MNFKENKFLTILAIVTLALFVAIIFFGWQAGAKAATASEEIDSKKSTIQRLESGKPYPSPQNLREQRNNLDEIRAVAAEVRDLMLKYRPAEITKTSPAAFTALFDSTEEGLRALYEKKGIALPGEWHVGFETYKNTPVKESVTGFLNYEMKAFDWLFRTIAEADVTAVENFHRVPLPPEIDREWFEVPEIPKERGSKRKQTAPEPVAKAMPFELTVTGREKSIRQLLADLADSDEYFVTLRAVRIQNERLEAPNQKQVEFAPAPVPDGGGDAPFGGAFVFPGADEAPDPPAEEATPPAEEAPAEGQPAAPGAEGEVPPGDTPVEEPAAPAFDGPADSGRILQIVAGDEKITAFIRGELILFEGNAALPGEAPAVAPGQTTPPTPAN